MSGDFNPLNIPIETKLIKNSLLSYIAINVFNIWFSKCYKVNFTYNLLILRSSNHQQ